MKQAYLGTINLIERLHRQFLEVIKHELDATGIQDINNIQAIILYNISDEEVTVGELTNRGYYLGSNVSYNLKKMVENGYLVQERSPHDRRSVRVHLSDKGHALRQQLNDLYDHHVSMLEKKGLGDKDIAQISKSLRALGRFWNEVMIDPAAALPDRPAE